MSPRHKVRLSTAKKPLRKKTPYTQKEFADLHVMERAYIRTLSHAQACQLFPTVKRLPKGVHIFYGLYRANGQPIALTDTYDAALGHAVEDELEVVRAH